MNRTHAHRTHAMPTPRARAGRRAGAALATVAMAGLLAACSANDILGNAELPPDVIDPGAMHNPQGALAAYRSAADLLRQGLNFHVYASGLLGDELTSVDLTASEDERIDSRQAGMTSPSYEILNRTRGQVRQALGMLREFAPESSPALQGHLYAMDGYAKVMLAELYCSGIPLSELVYGGDYRLEGASTTTQVLERALASFDTAVSISADSARLLDLARVGRARALLGLGRYADAADAVAAVPTGYAYAVQYPTDSMGNFFRLQSFAGSTNYFGDLSVSDLEGGNGLPFRSSGDPRTTANLVRTTHGLSQYHPAKYAGDGRSPIVLASGIEARLVEAEAALAAGGSWLAILNALRTDGSFTTRPNAADPAVTDTVWNAGGGGVAGLAPLADPGAPEARVDLLFRERAFWLHLTGQRLGDMRRLVRQYGRSPDSVFPTGTYQSSLRLGLYTYGTSMSLRAPEEEVSYNPLYSGCLSEGA